jgi:hypothetical protein
MSRGSAQVALCGRRDHFGAKGADRPVGLHRDLVRAALRRTPLPPSLLAHLVHRVRTDLDRLFGLLGPDADFPSRTTIREQSLFLLGYHLWVPETSHTVPDLALHG